MSLTSEQIVKSCVHNKMSIFKIIYIWIIVASFGFGLYKANAFTITYTYDNLNRVTQVVNGDGTTEEFTYDPAGNRIAHVIKEPDSLTLKGDINGDGIVDLQDSILARQVLAGMRPPGIRLNYADSGVDVNGDNKIGLSEVIYALQKAAGIR